MSTTQEKLEKEINDFREFVTGYAKSSYDDTKEVEPMALALTIKDGKPGLAVLQGIAPLFLNEQTKNLIPAVFEKINQELKPLALALISESWVVKKDNSDILNPDGSYVDPSYRPSQDPDRKSAMIIMFETYSKGAITSFEINDETKDLLEKEESPWEVKHSRKGRLSNLLQDHSKDFADMIEKQIQESLEDE